MKPSTDFDRHADAEEVESRGSFTLYSRADMSDPDPQGRDGPAIATRPGNPPYQAEALARVIETEVIPRLVLAKRGLDTPLPAEIPAALAPTDDDIVALTALTRLGNIDTAVTFVEAFCARGLPLEQVYLGLLAPAARLLGRGWEADTCDFTEVTIALRCLHGIAKALEPRFAPARARTRPDRRILLAAAPGEQHGFGLALVDQFFRRAGWATWLNHEADQDALLAMVAEMHFGVIGFSLAGDTHIEALAELIRLTRRASRNAAVGILVGGPLLIKQPELVGRLGADATAMDAEQAILQAEALLVLQGRGEERPPQ